MLLDTLRMQRRLREVGFPDEQANVITGKKSPTS